MIARLRDWILARWYARCRALDLEILWQSCKAQAPDLDHAKMAFAVHAYNDPAWMSLGRDEVYRRIDQLS